MHGELTVQQVCCSQLSGMIIPRPYFNSKPSAPDHRPMKNRVKRSKCRVQSLGYGLTLRAHVYTLATMYLYSGALRPEYILFGTWTLRVIETWRISVQARGTEFTP